MSDPAVAVAQMAGASPDLAESVEAHARLAVRAAELGARIVLFPELSLTGYHLGLTTRDALDAADERLLPLQSVADDRAIVVTAGAPVASPRGLHIATLSFVPHAPVAVYRKKHLGSSETAAFAAGSGGALLALGDEVVAGAICADSTHPDHADEAARSGATIYAASCLIADAAYETESGLLGRYAREHRMMVMMANYAPPVKDWTPAGRSALWASDGTLLACAPSRGTALVVAVNTPSGWTGRVVTDSSGS